LWNGLLGNIFPILCGVRQGGVLSRLLFSVYVDDLIRELRLSGYGAYIGNLFVGTIFYADDICLMSGSGFGLQKLLDICSDYGLKWDILFNPTKSHLFTIGGSNPSAFLHLRGKDLNWSSKVKYLGIYLLAESGFRIELNAAKQKYYACFNNIRSVMRQQVNEIMLLKLVKTYCLPRLLYGCEIWPREAIDMKELNVVWKNGFR